MWVRKRLDIGWSDLALGILACFRPGDGSRIQKRIEDCWSSAGDAFVCLSVRSGFDLVLAALDLPRGNEILISAISIPDIVRIIGGDPCSLPTPTN